MLFDRPQVASDLPEVELGDQFLPETFRGMGSGFGGRPTVFVAKRADNRICLIAELGDQQAAANCFLESDFAANGVTLFWTTEVDGVPTTTFLKWNPDGSSEYSSNLVGSG